MYNIIIRYYVTVADITYQNDKSIIVLLSTIKQLMLYKSTDDGVSTLQVHKPNE